MSETPKNPYAFPLDQEYGYQSGMTLRDWFAGQAISQIAHGSSGRVAIQDAAYAYAIADAMLAERDK